jgi:hypothetical protein
MRIVLIVVLGLLLAACGSAAVPSSSTGSGQAATTPASDLKPAATPTATATPVVMATAAGGIETKVAQALGRKVGVDSSKLMLKAKDAQDWPDSALGCRAAGMMYSQIVTPGFKLTYGDGAKTYEVHTDQSGTRAVLCQNKQPVELSTSGG